MSARLKLQWIRPKLVEVWKFMKLLRVEPYMFLLIFQFGLKGTPSSQLIQDKICTHWYMLEHNTSYVNKYCHDLPSTKEDDSHHGHYKSQILADSAKFSMYSLYATVLPSLIWALFIGAWVDRYVKARKILMMVNILAGIIENMMSIYLSLSWDTSVFYNILLQLPSSIAGGTIGARIAMTHYLTSTTPPKLMAIRFMIFEICITLGIPLGISLGGYILVQKPVFNNGEIRNFTVCYIIALVFEIIALLWVVFMVNEEVARKQEMKIEMELRGLKGKVGQQGTRIILKSDMSIEDSNVHPVKLLFDFQNVKSMIKTITKKRPNKGRKQIVILIVSLAIFMAEMMGLMSISSQFIQRNYYWKPDWTSYMGSISLVLISLSSMTLVPLMSKVFKVPDVKLALIGFGVNFICNMIKGTWISENAYYLAMVIGAIGSTASIGTRSHLSKVVDRNEMGKIMSFMSTLDTLAPVISTTIFTIIFTKTIDSYPGAIFQVIASLMLIPIVMLMWIDLFTEPPLVEGHHQRNNPDINQNQDVQDGSEISTRFTYQKHGPGLHLTNKHKQDQIENVEQNEEIIYENVESLTNSSSMKTNL